MRIHRWIGCVIAGSALMRPASVFAGTCALCRQALASGGNRGLIQGFYWSILLIAGVPLLIMGVVGYVVWRQRKMRSTAHQLNPTV